MKHGTEPHTTGGQSPKVQKAGVLSRGKKRQQLKDFRTPQKGDRQAAGNLDNLTAIP